MLRAGVEDLLSAGGAVSPDLVALVPLVPRQTAGVTPWWVVEDATPLRVTITCCPRLGLWTGDQS